MQWENISIFISSTFNDMHAERDYLVKDVFPELAVWCEKRKIRLTDIDLRWGVTAEDARSNNVVKVCLEGIDKCRPFFLCFLGQRRGWVPKTNELGDTADNYEDGNGFLTNHSVTEIEIEHAMLAPMYRLFDKVQPEPAKHALFFFRKDPFGDSLSETHRKVYKNDGVLDDCGNVKSTDDALESFKEKIRKFKDTTDYTCEWVEDAETPELLRENNGTELCKGRLVNFCIDKTEVSSSVYRKIEEADLLKDNGSVQPENGLIELKYVVLASLMLEIEAEYPERKDISSVSTDDKYTIDAEQQEIFMHNAAESFIPVPDISDKLNSYVNSSSVKPFILTAKAGLGKTTLLAKWIEENKQDGVKVIFRFCGASDLASEQYSLWDSIFHELNIDIPPTVDELRQKMGQLFETVCSNEKTVILIDAVDQLPDGVDMLEWMPKVLPDNVKLIISVKQADDISVSIDDSTFENAEILPVDDARKECLISEYLKKNLKSLDPVHIGWICGVAPHDEAQRNASGNPLYLKILLSELRVFGAFRQLGEQITKFGHTPFEAFNHVLETLENERVYNIIDPKKSVPFLFGLLSCARKGLSEDEIAYCFKQEFGEDKPVRATIRFFLRRVRPFIARRSGRMDFLYNEFRNAALKYANMRNWHLMLSYSLYATRPGECAWHTRMSDSKERSISIYSDLDFLNRYYLTAGAFHLKTEILNVGEGIIDQQIRIFINDTAAVLQKNPECTPPTFYKELSGQYKSQALKLCDSPWVKMDELTTRIPVESVESVKPASIQEADIRAGYIARQSHEAFLLVATDTVCIVDINTMQTISTFTIEAIDTVSNLFCDSTGKYLVIVMHDSFSIYELNREKNGGVISCNMLLQKNCRRMRFRETPLVFEDNNTLIYQTAENSIFAITLSSLFQERCVTQSEHLLNGYFVVAGQEYFLYKTSFGYNLCTADFPSDLELNSPVNDIILYENSLLLLLDENKMLMCDNITLKEQKQIETSFVPKSIVPLGLDYLISDEHGNLYTWSSTEGFRNHGMLSVDRWDKEPELFSLSDKKVFFFSNSRYAILEESRESNTTILRAKGVNEIAETLVIDSKNECVLHATTNIHAINNVFRSNLYGLMAMVNLKCDWNPNGDALFMGDGQTAILLLANGEQKQIDAPSVSTVIVDIMWLEWIEAFMILYRSGQILLIHNDGQIKTIKTFESLTGNYLVCDCGNHFCVVTKRRLVQQVTTYEETAVAVFDRAGRMVHEEHIRGVDQQSILNIAYDNTVNEVYLISQSEAQVIKMNEFSSVKRKFDFTFYTSLTGVAVNKYILYFVQQNKGICAVDMLTGKMVCCFPLHRTVTGIYPSMGMIVAVENNKKVSKVILE